MKKTILTCLVILSFLKMIGQQINDHQCAKRKTTGAERKPSYSLLLGDNPPENKYDLKFYHLNLNVERNTLFISGNVKSVAKVVATSLDSFAFLLHQNHTIDSVYINGAKRNFLRRDSLVLADAGTPIPQNQLFEAIVYYQGTCPTNTASNLGNGYNIFVSPMWGEQVAWSLSESRVAYQWFPCKQDLRDKIDSSWVYATTDSVNQVGSNGLLKNVVDLGAKKRFEWKSSYPIDYYLISIAVSKYKQHNLYAHPQYLNGDSILIQNFVYNNTFNSGSWGTMKARFEKVVPTIEFLSNIYSMYPFYKEKYGFCMADMGGGMEHQTMTTLGENFNYEVYVHELGHQWWGDNVTCAAWKDIFINEAWATYTEYLCDYYLPTVSGMSASSNMNNYHTSVMSQPGGSSYLTNADTLDESKIFNTRLVYAKGSAIIHMLRYEINNDSVFFPAIRSFQNTYAGSTASVIDFKVFMENYTGLSLQQFFNQWYYGEGYPTFNVKWNHVSGNFFIKTVQTQSMPSSVPLFITLIDYRVVRAGYPDTIMRLTHAQLTENYTIPLSGTVSAVFLDPANWILNKTVGPTKDATLGVTGIEENLLAQAFVGPNPTSDVLNINLYNNDKAVVEIVDVTGKLIQRHEITSRAEYNISNYANGIYTVNIKTPRGELIKSTKVVKN